jgi:hypothetical protein
MRRIIEWFLSRLRLSDLQGWRGGAECGAVPSDLFRGLRIGLFGNVLTGVSDDFHVFDWVGEDGSEGLTVLFCGVEVDFREVMNSIL